MRKLLNVRVAVLFGVVATGWLLVGFETPADARPKYHATIKNSKEYKKISEQVVKVKCGVCHPTNDKKKHNDFGLAMKKHLGEIKKTGETDTKKIEAALVKCLKEKSSVEGKTFGDLVEEGKLPGKAPEKKEDGDKEDK
jgi:hypothetical protein